MSLNTSHHYFRRKTMNTKMLSLVLIGVLLFSVVPVLAQGHEDDEQGQPQEKNQEEAQEDNAADQQERVKEQNEKTKSVRQSIEDRVMKKKEILDRAKKTREET